MGEHAPVTSSGTPISKIACFCVEVGDALKTTAQFMPIALGGLSFCGTPLPLKSPATVLIEQSPTLVAMKFNVVGTARSVPLLFSTVKGNENLATIVPLAKFTLF